MKTILQIICDALAFEPESELSVLLTTDAYIQQLNEHYRHKDKATDVLSFSQLEAVSFESMPGRCLGDVVVSCETCYRQAQVLGVAFSEELARLLIHGILHLLGYDHVHGGRQARKMVLEEQRLLALIQPFLRSASKRKTLSSQKTIRNEASTFRKSRKKTTSRKNQKI